MAAGSVAAKEVGLVGELARTVVELIAMKMVE